MFRAWSPRLKPVLAGLGLALMASPAWPQANWQFSTFVNVSQTMGVNDGRICLGEGSRQDIGCPTYAPSVSSGGLLTATSVATGGLAVTGATSLTTISATAGSFTSLTVGGLPVVGGASPDRVVSGTTSLVVVSNSGFISLTQLGSNTGWFDPNRGLVTIGVSSTGTVSTSAGLFFGGVTGGSGLALSNGTSGPLDRISTSGVASGASLAMAVADVGTISFTLGGTAGAAYLHPTLGLVGPGVSTTGPISGTSLFVANTTGGSGLALSNGTSGPLDRISTSGVASGASLAMAVANIGTISFTLGGTAGAAYLHPTLGLVGPGVSTTGPISGTRLFVANTTGGSGLALSNGTSGPLDRISTSGVASGASLAMAVANIGTISFTLGGTAGAAYLHPTLGLVGPGVSTTGPISGTRLFVANTTGGSGLALSNGTSGPLDRISTSGVASGASLAMAVANVGTISFTLGGTAGAAYLHPTLGYVGPGVSTTAPVSATRLFVATDATVNGRVSASVVQVARDSSVCNAETLGTIRLDPATGKIQVCRQ